MASATEVFVIEPVSCPVDASMSRAAACQSLMTSRGESQRRSLSAWSSPRRVDGMTRTLRAASARW